MALFGTLTAFVWPIIGLIGGIYGGGKLGKLIYD
jgi:hypothetical protein